MLQSQRVAFLAASCVLASATDGWAFDRTMYDRGASTYLQLTFHGLDRSAFLGLQETLLSHIALAAVGAGDSIVFRDLETTSQESGSLGYQAQLLFDFTPADATPASLLASTLSHSPQDVLPVDVFGQYSVSHAMVLQCPMPCGDHGMRVPEVTTGSGAVSCTCQCDYGWATDQNQPFDSFAYCTVTTSNTPTTNSNTNKTMTTTSNTTTSPTAGDWRPPVPSYPPPPPASKTTKKKVPLFKWVIIGISVIVMAVLVFVLCRTRCCGLWGLCCSDGCCSGRSSHGHFKYPAVPHRIQGIHVHAMNPPPYFHAPMPYQAHRMHTESQGQSYPYRSPPPQHFPMPPEAAQMAPLGHGFSPPEQ